MKILITLYSLLAIAAFASTPPISRIDEKSLKSAPKNAEVFEADTISYSKVYMTNGVVHKITEKQLEKLKLEAYKLLGDGMKFQLSTYGQLRVCHIINMKVTKVISGKLKVGDTRQLLVSDHIDSMCPHFKYYGKTFSSKPKLVWLLSWEVTHEGILKQNHAIATPKEFKSL